ncbi:MAG: zinc ribbon domain-containing protein [Piscinibacter sp.]|uniref:zinc ribbon domain-containing protein n=1 Tax=Piscinibacter sp. TaxID=1903157 RepID=UPI002586D065|nr:zinc ribbon domain-containing protein [Piscinibacter sp.]MCW5663385.1 zinc ribbon domain-containing protein [Piscinibacter sp.]
MPIACTQCGTQNADGARFCHACGTALAGQGQATPLESSAFDSVACDDCGHLNAPGTRYCAKCGYSLVGTVIVSRKDLHMPPVAAAPVTPPAAPAPRGRVPTPDEDTFDPLHAPTQVMGAETAPGRFSAMAAAGTAAAAPPPPGAGGGKGALIAIVIAVLVLGGAAAWWFTRPAAEAPPWPRRWNRPPRRRRWRPRPRRRPRPLRWKQPHRHPRPRLLRRRPNPLPRRQRRP